MMPEDKSFKVAILWRGDRKARQAATPQNNRFHRIFEELAAVGIHAEPAVYEVCWHNGLAPGRSQRAQQGLHPRRSGDGLWRLADGPSRRTVAAGVLIMVASDDTHRDRRAG